MVKQAFLDKDEKMSQKTFKSWIRSQLFKSTSSNKSKNYWTLRGYTNEEAVHNISSIQRSLSHIRSNNIIELKKKGDDWKRMFNVHIEYYTSRGMSLDDAKKANDAECIKSLEKKKVEKYGKTDKKVD